MKEEENWEKGRKGRKRSNLGFQKLVRFDATHQIGELKKVCNSVTGIVRKTVHLAKFSPIISRFQESTNYRLDSKSVMYSKEMFLKSEKISKKIKKCNYWWHFCLVYLVYLFQFCLVPLFVISVQSSDSSFVHKTGLIFLVGSFYIVSDQYSTDFSIVFH